MSDGNGKKGRFEISFETRQLVDAGRKIAEGGMWFYRDMEKTVGLDIILHRGWLSSARRILQREEGFIFESVIKTGLRRLKNADKVKIPVDSLLSIRRKIGKTRKAMGTIDVEKLNQEEKIEIMTSATVLHVAENATTQKTISKVRAGVTKVNGILPVSEETLKLFAEKE